MATSVSAKDLYPDQSVLERVNFESDKKRRVRDLVPDLKGVNVHVIVLELLRT